jgi:hypothetical protein
MLIRAPKRYRNGFVGPALAAALMFAFSNPAASQSQKPPERQSTEVTLSGFLTDGGVVNLIEGDVAYFPSGGRASELKPQQELSNQDAIQTGQNGRVEILLNPGYYLRLSANTYVVFLDLAPNNLKLKISKGSAICEIVVIGNAGWYYIPLDDPITISTPAGEFVTVKGGVYRFDVGSDETGLKVTKGLSVVAGARVEGGMKATLRNGSASVTKFNKDAGDGFDIWSRERAGLLVKSNKSLRKTDWHRQLRSNPLSYLNIKDTERHERRNERYVVSAIGGFVNFLEAGVTYKHGDAAWTELSEGVGLEYGDRVKTGPDSRAEILVYPNCYLRLAGNTEIVYARRSDGYAAIKLLRGSAIISSRLDGKEHTPVSFVAPQSECEILRKGVYRLNRSANGLTEILVYEGRARIAGREIKDGQKAVLAEGGPAIGPMQKNALDSFDVWSRQRSPALSLSRRVQLRGMWYFDQPFGAYTFVPGWLDFHSPYGGRYSVGFLGRWH